MMNLIRGKQVQQSTKWRKHEFMQWGVESCMSILQVKGNRHRDAKAVSSFIVLPVRVSQSDSSYGYLA